MSWWLVVVLCVVSCVVGMTWAVVRTAQVRQSWVAYVASGFADWQTTRYVQGVLRELGWTIECDWTLEAEHERHGTPDELTVEQKTVIAIKDMTAAVNCRLLVLIFGETAPMGGLLEAGGAIAHNRYVMVIAPPRDSVFWHLPNVVTFASVEEWESTVRQRAGGSR